jgi:hypothetical protein
MASQNSEPSPVRVGVGIVDDVVELEVVVGEPPDSSPEHAAARTTRATAPQRRDRMLSLDR